MISIVGSDAVALMTLRVVPTDEINGIGKVITISTVMSRIVTITLPCFFLGL